MMEDAGSWLPFEGGTSIGLTGSEGVILRDDEYEGGARITLECDGFAAPYSITCGVYGWLVHTRFFTSEWEAEVEYAAMQPELAAIVDVLPLASELDDEAKVDAAIVAINRFVDRFP
jgi:hypothetical protein